jgi:hypothetical protein
MHHGQPARDDAQNQRRDQQEEAARRPALMNRKPPVDRMMYRHRRARAGGERQRGEADACERPGKRARRHHQTAGHERQKD